MTLAYRVESRPVGDTQTPKPFAVARCASCEKVGAVALPPNSHNPERIGKKFRGEGWEFDAFRKSGAICPDCVTKRAALRRGQSSKPEHPAMSKPVLVNGGGSPAVTFEQRQQVKELLTGTFDEKLGYYLDGYSDQRIADCVPVPVVVVREMREMWLGPIRSVPELAAVQADIVALKTRVEAFEREGKDIKDAVFALKQRLDGELVKLGVRS